ncbi:MAG TPA: MerR family transcriptional regulator [Mycobacteriales bacterium]|nr:MerR family transcriptional regulator [Mycobacteriales bacterium]
MLTIGQLARAAGLTPKALRHYDRIGLLRPAAVDAAGQRFYAPEQLGQAQLVARLRAADLPLEQVRECLAGDDATVAQILLTHRSRMAARLARTQSALHQLEHLIHDGIGATMSTSDTASVGDETQLAKDLFNGVWRLLEKEDRSPAEDERMIHMAHASRYHWEQVGTASNMSIGEWQISRVYATVGRAEPALHHAHRALQITQENEIGDFQLAFSYEALARASAVAGDPDEARRWTEQALSAADDIAKEFDRELVLTDLETIPGQPRFW